MHRALGLLFIGLLLSAAGPSTEPVPRIVDATAEDCQSLAHRLASLPAARSEPSRSLGEQGVKLCGEGRLRIGVAKLRRALRAAQDPRPSAATAGAPLGTDAQPPGTGETR
jgi:hypothetical protein